MELRRLDPIADEPLYRQSYGWLEQAPQWRQTTEKIFGADTYDGYLYNANQAHRLDVGVFNENDLIAVVGVTLRLKHTYEIGLEAARFTPAELIVTAGCMIRDQLKTYGMRGAFMWVVKQNRVMRQIVQLIDFKPNGATMLMGQYRNRPVEWLMYTLEV